MVFHDSTGDNERWIFEEVFYDSLVKCLRILLEVAVRHV